MEINIYTDGAASPNPGVGGSAAIIQWEYKGIKYHKEYQIYEKESTNQRMEIGSAFVGLVQANEEIKNFIANLQQEEAEELKSKPIHYIIYSDSAYVVNCINQKWYVNWRYNGWVNAKKQPVANKNLWENLIKTIEDIIYSNEFNIVDFIKVKGHSDNKLNNAVDSLAVEARKILKGKSISDYVFIREE